jgi:hypothetical protein
MQIPVKYVRADQSEIPANSPREAVRMVRKERRELSNKLLTKKPRH